MSKQFIAAGLVFWAAVLSSGPGVAGTGKVIGWEVDGRHYATEIEACRAASRYNSTRGKGVFTGKIERFGEDTITCEIRDEDGSVGAPQVMRVWGQADDTPRPLGEGQAVPLAPERGMLASDDKAFRELAVKLKLFLIVRDSNKAAVRFTGKPGYLPKPEALKAKTIKAPSSDPNLGLVRAHPKDPELIISLAKDKLTYQQYVDQLRADGFEVGPAPHYLVQDQKTKANFYSDIDLHGVYDERGQQRWTPSMKDELLNPLLSDRLIQHGPHDCWEKRNSPKAKTNRGPQPPVTVYTPDGLVYSLQSAAHMQAFYAQRKLPWPYAKGFKAEWCPK